MLIEIKFEGVDYWSRPVYKAIKTKNRYGSTNILFPDRRIAPNDTTEEINAYFKENISELCYFGDSFDCEPMGTTPSGKLKIID